MMGAAIGRTIIRRDPQAPTTIVTLPDTTSPTVTKARTSGCTRMATPTDIRRATAGMRKPPIRPRSISRIRKAVTGSPLGEIIRGIRTVFRMG